MTSPVAQVREVDDHGRNYQALAFTCPGCKGDLHMLPISGDVPQGRARWDFDGNLENPTLSPSILTRASMKDGEFVCHSFLRAGVFEFLTDCTHELAGQSVPMAPLPDWCVRE